jgi:polysaccharide pyruvyl transferase WcaK-like protein
MSLRLLNAYTSRNLGDAAIYETLVKLAGAQGASSNLAAPDRAFARGLRQAEPAQTPTAWVSVGGDVFNNARPWAMTRRFAANLVELASAPAAHTFMFGQGIPSSCRGGALLALALLLRRLSSVTVRDEHSLRRLRRLGVPAELSYDLAFAYSPRADAHQTGRALFQQAGVDPERAVVTSVRGFDAMYAHDAEAFEERLAVLLSSLARRGHQPAVIIQATADGSDSDHAVVERLRARVPGLAVLDPFQAPGGAHPVDALFGVLALAHAVIAVRYHTAVLRLLAGKVPWSLHYSTKGADLAQRLQLPGVALERLDPLVCARDIEASAGRSFDPRMLSREIHQRFDAAHARARQSTRASEARAI